jgi:quinol monooxygenase YgiN
VIAVIAKLTVREDKVDEFKAAATEMVEAVRRNEAGKTLEYLLCQSASNPAEFVFFERYADEAALAEHGKTPHMAAFGAKLAGMLAARPEIVRLQPVASIAQA